MLDCGFRLLLTSLSDRNMSLGDVLLPPGRKQRCLYLRVQGLFTLLTGINPGKSHGQGPWVSHEMHSLDDSSLANREARSCSIFLMGEMRLQWRPRLELSRLGLQVILDVFGVAP